MHSYILSWDSDKYTLYRDCVVFCPIFSQRMLGALTLDRDSLYAKELLL